MIFIPCYLPPTRFERATPSLGRKRSIQLSYGGIIFYLFVKSLIWIERSAESENCRKSNKTFHSILRTLTGMAAELRRHYVVFTCQKPQQWEHSFNNINSSWKKYFLQFFYHKMFILYLYDIIKHISNFMGWLLW